MTRPNRRLRALVVALPLTVVVACQPAAAPSTAGTVPPSGGNTAPASSGLPTTEPGPTLRLLGGAWRSIAEAPIGGRTGAAMVWTGSEALVWGGAEAGPDGATPSTGAAWDPAADAWRPIPEAPIEGRRDPVAAWSGTELLVWGGHRGPEDDPEWLADGAAYDPATDRWRSLATSPVSGPDTVGALLGRNLVVLSSTGAASYDPKTDAWRELPVTPIRTGARTAAAAGGRMLVLAFGDGSSDPVEGTILHPGLARWGALDVPLEPTKAIRLVAAEGRILVPEGGQTLDPRTGTWGPMARCEVAATGAAWTGRYLIGRAGAYDSVGDECLSLPPPPAGTDPSASTDTVGVWTGSEYVTWGIDGGAAFTPAS